MDKLGSAGIIILVEKLPMKAYRRVFIGAPFLQIQKRG
jgi:hypothetical protein